MCLQPGSPSETLCANSSPTVAHRPWVCRCPLPARLLSSWPHPCCSSPTSLCAVLRTHIRAVPPLRALYLLLSGNVLPNPAPAPSTFPPLLSSSSSLALSCLCPERTSPCHLPSICCVFCPLSYQNVTFPGQSACLFLHCCIPST